MIINHNLNAMNSSRMLNANNSRATKSMEKLSSGLRINRAGDDAAGLAISEKMRGQIAGLDQAANNAQDGISLIQTAEGALNETHSILQRMRELAVQASNDTNVGVDRTEIQKELNQLADEVDRIANTTEFNTQKLLNGDKVGLKAKVDGKVTYQNNSSLNITGDITISDKDLINKSGTIIITRTNGTVGASTLTVSNFHIGDPNGLGMTTASITGLNQLTFNGATLQFAIAGGNDLMDMKIGESITVSLFAMEDAETDVSKALSFQIGANSGQNMLVGIGKMDASSLGIRKGSDAVDVSDAESATAAITSINSAIEKVSAQRAQLGAYQNRLEHTINNLGTSSENLSAAESRIRDVDMAAEMSEYSKNNILAQAAQAMLAQANQQPQNVLQLLR
ncbi:A-type flagellin [Oxobacter pfennigii]|uniref:Flagellin n=1 Tax=Oxobacter pfennigii TaxID=36849 RepID=A0A0P8X1H3_9CLOT|nr:flagellin [Oxobacter pfennigii]KPU44667.1 A-type flagellin [Oxobacter pfennigii]